tara:strand:+ start:161 stop:430 length:270 start_codon:yes stop_codon:yes gene_type:complete
MADADANAAALKRQVRPSQVGRILTKVLGCVVCWFLIFWALMFWIALIPIAATTDAPVWARSYLFLSTAHLLDLWQGVAAPPPPPPPIG